MVGIHIIEDGNDLDAIHKAIEKAREDTERPSLILIKTHIGYGSPHKHDTFEAHGSPLGDEEVKLTKQNLGWPDKTFSIPRKSVKPFSKSDYDRSKYEKEWLKVLAAYRKKYPKLAK